MKISEINNNILIEGINDAGIFKAIFIAGLPGSGKSTLAKRLLLHCRVYPKIINFDKFYEYLSIKHNIDVGPNANPREIIPILTKAQDLNKEQLIHYVHNMLPLLIDGTATNPKSMLNRIDILYSMGYDIGILWIRTDLETSIERAAKRPRHVDPDYIIRASHQEDHNIQYLSEKIPIQGGGPFIIINTISNDIEFTQAANQINNFYMSPIMNPTGNKYFNVIKSTGSKSLSPHIYRNVDDVGVAMSKWTSKMK